jgi:hypothetical protein
LPEKKVCLAFAAARTAASKTVRRNFILTVEKHQYNDTWDINFVKEGGRENP